MHFWSTYKRRILWKSTRGQQRCLRHTAVFRKVR